MLLCYCYAVQIDMISLAVAEENKTLTGFVNPQYGCNPSSHGDMCKYIYTVHTIYIYNIYIYISFSLCMCKYLLFSGIIVPSQIFAPFKCLDSRVSSGKNVEAGHQAKVSCPYLEDHPT